MLDLVTHHAGQAQVSDNKENGNYREPQRKLVRKHLRTGTDPAEEWIFGVRCPAANDDSVNAKRSNGEYKENSYVYISDHHRNTKERTAEWYDRDRDDGRHHSQARCEPVVKRVHAARREIFFQQQLEHVGNRLKKTGRPNTIRAEPVLNKCAYAALGVNGIGNHGQNHSENADDLQQRGDDKKRIHCNGRRSTLLQQLPLYNARMLCTPVML